MIDYPQFDGSVAFERHRQRRAQGVPTITVIIGEPDVAERCWAAWQRARGAPVSVAAMAGLEPILRSWLGIPVVTSTFSSVFIQHAARAHGVSCDEFRVRLAAHSEGQRDRFAEQLSRRLAWSRPLIDAALETREDLLPERVRDGFPRVLSELAELLPSGLPALWLERFNSAAPDLQHATAAPLLQIAEAVPRAELAFAASEAQLDLWQRSAPEREVMLLRAGVVRVEPMIKSRPANAGTPDAEGEPHTPSPALVGREGRPELAPDDPADLARSRAERALYERLEALPLTRGLFGLNVQLDEPFGSRPLEVDLLCQALRLAVEVDGYHHFRDASAYRRDREKDVLLQGLGYTVLRVLASDVEHEIGYVIDKINGVVNHRRREKSK